MKNNWWHRPAGGKEIAAIAIPMIISSGSFALMQLTDRVLLTWFDPLCMGASFSAGQLAFLLAAFPFCVAGYANAFVSQYNGSGQNERIAPIVWQGVFLGLILLPVFLFLFWLNRFPFHWFGHSAQLVEYESIYFNYLLPGLAAMIGNEALSSFFSGRKKMKTVMSINVFCVLLNIVFDYILIFGINGHLRWGLAGAAIATTLAQWIRFLIYFSLIALEDRRTKIYHFWRSCRFNRQEFLALLRFGGMSAIQFMTDVVTFTLFILLLGKVGEEAAMVSAIAFNLNTLIFLPVVGLGVAVVTLVGNRLGANEPELAKRAALTSLTAGIFITGFFVILFLTAPDLFLSLYAKQDPEGFRPIHDLTVIILRYVSLYLFFDTINIVFCSTLKGAGDTRFTMLTTIGLGFFLIVPAVLGVTKFGAGIHWCWIMLTLSTIAACLIFSLRFFQGKWMKMRLFKNSNVKETLLENISSDQKNNSF